MGANAISRPQTQRNLLRMSVQAKGSPFDSIRRWQTPEMGLDFPDTEEVTSSNLVRPTQFFENLSSIYSLNGSQTPAVLVQQRRSRHWRFSLAAGRCVVPIIFLRLAVDVIEHHSHPGIPEVTSVSAARNCGRRVRCTADFSPCGGRQTRLTHRPGRGVLPYMSGLA